jgi:hypothetical protein
MEKMNDENTRPRAARSIDHEVVDGSDKFLLDAVT